MGKSIEKILITGGAGFIGSALSMNLIEKGYNVTVIDNLLEQIHGSNMGSESYTYNLIKDKVNFIYGDVRDKEKLKLAVRNQDAIIHLAAETGTGQSMYEISRYSEVNVQATANLLNILCNESHNVKKLIVSSTRALYGEGKYKCKVHGDVYPTFRNEHQMKNGFFDCYCPICGEDLNLVSTDEYSKIHPSSIYGITKSAQEQLIMTLGKNIGIQTFALRYQNVYGPGQSLKNPYTGILSIFSNQILNGADINIFEDGKESRDFIYIDDVVSATSSMLKTDISTSDIFNVGSGKGITVIKVVDELMKNYNGNSEIKISGNFRVGDIRHNVADIKKIQSAFNWKPKTDFEKGIEKFSQWVKMQNREESLYLKSLAEMRTKGLLK